MSTEIVKNVSQMKLFDTNQTLTSQWWRGVVEFLKGRSRKALEDLAVEIKERGGEAVVSVCDHADIEATEALFHNIDQMVWVIACVHAEWPW